MTILIVKQNIPLFQKLGVKNFQDNTKHTATFETTQKEFQALKEAVRKYGNPYALMTWI